MKHHKAPLHLTFQDFAKILVNLTKRRNTIIFVFSDQGGSPTNVYITLFIFIKNWFSTFTDLWKPNFSNGLIYQNEKSSSPFLSIRIPPSISAAFPNRIRNMKVSLTFYNYFIWYTFFPFYGSLFYNGLSLLPCYQWSVINNQINAQERTTTHYDVHETLIDIVKVYIHISRVDLVYCSNWFRDSNPSLILQMELMEHLCSLKYLLRDLVEMLVCIRSEEQIRLIKLRNPIR